MRKLYILALSLFLFQIGQSQIKFTVVDLSTSQITLKNMGASTEDISSLRLCALFAYDALSSGDVTVVDGDLNLDPGESVTVSWDAPTLNMTASDLGLYTASGSFGLAVNMLDFLQWGAGGLGREGVAVTAGLWTAGEFIDSGSPFYFTGGAMDSGLGSWSSNPPATTGPCTDLFFSEYIEGSSNNKAIEIYNPTGSAVDLTDYQIQRFANGGTDPGGIYNFPAGTTLADGDVWVSANGQADAAILNVADEDTSSITFFNGDDAMILYKISTGDTLDIIGIVGEDPGSSWTVGSGTTANNTLVRMATVQEGTTDWALSSTQWDVLDNNDFSNIGSHTMIPCGATSAFVNFASDALAIDESQGTLNIGVSLSNSSGAPVTVDVSLMGGTATDGDDFTQTLPTTLSFDGMSDETMSISMEIIDDLDVEGAETIILMLGGITGDATSDIDMLTITINPSDAAIPTYEIGEINTVDMDGVADSADVECKIIGTVYGVNLRPAGLQFTMHDGTGGIGVFNATGNLGYTVQEGDEIRMIGTISQFSGLTQMNPDSIVFLSAGNPLNDALVVNALNEDTESELVTLECVTLDDPSQWSPGGSGFNVDVTNNIGSYTLRIDADVDLFNAPAPTGTFTVTGIGGQFDSSPPFDSGYQLLPRYSADIVENDPSCIEPPVNDSCDGAIDITDLITYDGITQVSDIFTNNGATIQATDPINGWECFGEPDGSGSAPSLENTVWFFFDALADVPLGCSELIISDIYTSDCNGTVSDYIDDGDTQIALYLDACIGGTPVACNEDSPDASNGNFFAGISDIVVPLNSANYYLMIDGFNFNGAISDGEFCIEVVSNCVTAIEELQNIRVKAFPNPGNGDFILETEAQINQIQVFNALGQEVSFNWEQYQNRIEMDMTSNEAGIYQILLQNEQGSSTLQYVLTK
ncbi:MAG: lamin tail domain-containing protein [Bacteroidota bacterium]